MPILRFKHPTLDKTIAVDSPDGSIPSEAQLDAMFASAGMNPANSAPERGNPEQTWGQAAITGLSNVPSNAVDVAKNIGGMITHPLDAIKNLSKLIPSSMPILGALNTPQENAQVYQAIGQDIANKWSNPKKYFSEKPVEAALDISTLFGGAGVGLRAAGIAKAAKAASVASTLTDPFQMAAKAAGTTMKGLGNIISPVIGMRTGAGAAAIKQAAKEGMFSQNFNSAMRGEIPIESVVRNMDTKLGELADARRMDYESRLQSIKDSGVVHDTTPIETKMNEMLNAFGVKVERQLPKEMQDLVDSGVAIPQQLTKDEIKNGAVKLNMDGVRGGNEVRAAAEKAFDAFQSFDRVGDKSPYGLDTLRMQLRAIADESSQAQALISPIMNKIKSTIEKSVPGYQKMLTKYSDDTNKINELRSALSIQGEGKSVDTAIRKLSTIFRDVNDYRLAKLDELDPGGILRGQVAGTILSKQMPRGLLSQSMSIGGSVGLPGIAAVLTHNPSLLAAMLPLLASGSPKLMGRASQIAGSAMRGAEKIPTQSNIAFEASKAAGLASPKREDGTY